MKTDTPVYSNRQNAIRAARKALGGEAIHGVDFVVTQPEGGFSWKEKAPAAPKGPTASALDALDAPAAKAARSARSKRPAKPAPASRPRKTAAEALGKVAVTGKRAQALADAQAGKLPPPPDFSANTHARYRGKLADLVKLVKAGDLKALKAVEIPTYSSSVKAMARYRDLAVTALEARKARG